MQNPKSQIPNSKSKPLRGLTRGSAFQIPKWLGSGAHLLALVLIFGVSLAAFLRFEGSALMQLYVVVAAVVAYVAWGLLYHYFSGRLRWGIVFEYLLVGALVILLFFWTLFA